MANGFIVGERAVQVTAALAHANCAFLSPASAAGTATCTPPALPGAGQPLAGPAAPPALLPAPLLAGTTTPDASLSLPRDGQELELTALDNDESAAQPTGSRKPRNEKCKSSAATGKKRSIQPPQVCSDLECTFACGSCLGCAQ
jgi:hypothetical protein